MDFSELIQIQSLVQSAPSILIFWLIRELRDFKKDVKGIRQIAEATQKSLFNHEIEMAKGAIKLESHSETLKEHHERIAILESQPRFNSSKS